MGQLTAAEGRAGRCIFEGCNGYPTHRVCITARPEAISGGYMTFTTPHKACEHHIETNRITVTMAARDTEQAEVRTTASREQGWDAETILLGITGALIMTRVAR